MATHYCTECKTDKPTNEFIKRGDSGKYRNQCKVCMYNQQKNQREYINDISLKYRYCLTCYKVQPLTDYYQLVDNQTVTDILEERELLPNAVDRHNIMNDTFHSNCLTCCIGKESLCSTCNAVKSIDNFLIVKSTNKPYHKCRTCSSEYAKQPKIKQQKAEYRERPAIKEKLKEQKKEYRERPENKQRQAEYQKRPETKEQMKQYRARPEVKEKKHVYNKEYKANSEIKEKTKVYNREYLLKPGVMDRIKNKMRGRYATDLNYKLQRIMRSRFYSAVQKDFKVQSVLTMIGCSSDHLLRWLEFQFDEEMTWDNHGEYWHIDHIKPCALFDFTNVDEQKQCFHWTNLQPLYKTENLSKSDTYNDEIRDRAAITLQQFYEECADESINEIYTEEMAGNEISNNLNE